MAGLAAFRRVQIGKEAVAGTPVAATAKVMGCTMDHALGSRKIVQPSDDRGSLAESFRSFTSQYDWKDALKGNATFEDILYLLRMALVGGVTPTVVDTSAYQWLYEPSLTAANAADSCTIEFGDDAQAYQTNYAFATDLQLSGQLDAAIQMEAALAGRDLAAVTFTPALANRTVEDARSEMTVHYSDDSGGTLGTTRLAATVLDWTWKLPKHFVPKHRQDGSLDYLGYGEAKMAPVLDVTLETPEAATLRAKYTSETRQLYRLICTGSKVGAATALKTIQIDGAYKITNLDKLAEKDGVDTVKLTLTG
ncbi:MAG: hypothetical protein ACRD1F_11860, partial [Terriglobales bacterium]